LKPENDYINMEVNWSDLLLLECSRTSFDGRTEQH